MSLESEDSQFQPLDSRMEKLINDLKCQIQGNPGKETLEIDREDAEILISQHVSYMSHNEKLVERAARAICRAGIMIASKEDAYTIEDLHWPDFKRQAIFAIAAIQQGEPR